MLMSGTISSMIYVYDGRECVGFVLARGRKAHEALDREQRSLGLFKTAAAAANFVFNAAASETVVAGDGAATEAVEAAR
jgi:hypothetical protein